MELRGKKQENNSQKQSKKINKNLTKKEIKHLQIKEQENQKKKKKKSALAVNTYLINFHLT